MCSLEYKIQLFWPQHVDLVCLEVPVVGAIHHQRSLVLAVLKVLLASA